MVFERVFSTKTERRIDDDSDEDDGDGEEDGKVSAGGSFPASVLPTEAAFCSSRPEWFSCPSIREDTKQTHTREGRCIGRKCEQYLYLFCFVFVFVFAFGITRSRHFYFVFVFLLYLYLYLLFLPRKEHTGGAVYQTNNVCGASRQTLTSLRHPLLLTEGICYSFVFLFFLFNLQNHFCISFCCIIFRR